VILQLSHWRVSFWMVAGLGLVMIVSVLVAVPESLPAERRHGGELRSFAVAGRQVLGRRRYVGYLLVSGSVFLGLVLVITVRAFVALVVLWPRLAGRDVSHVAGRAGLLLGVNLLVLLTAATQLNAQFLFADWSDLGGAFGGTLSTTKLSRGSSARAAAAKTVKGTSGAPGNGAVPRVPRGKVGPDGVLDATVTGPLSGITAPVVVRLSPGYAAPANGSRRYPVLLTGRPVARDGARRPALLRLECRVAEGRRAADGGRGHGAAACGAPHLSLARLPHRPRLAGREHPGLPPRLVTPTERLKWTLPTGGLRMCDSAPSC
jgi:hypothetical protein